MTGKINKNVSYINASKWRILSYKEIKSMSRYRFVKGILNKNIKIKCNKLNGNIFIVERI